MKIAILAHTLFPICEPYAGGMEMITHLLAKTLGERGHTVDLFAAKGSDPQLNIIEYATESDQDQLEKPSVPIPEFMADRFECFRLSEALLKIASGNYDVVHNNTQHYLPILLGEKMQLPFITTLHIPAFEFLQYAFQFLGENPRQVFTCVSKSLAQVYGRLGVASRTVYNGIDLNSWTFKPEAAEKALLWFGRICPEKGTHQAIKVAKELNLKLYLAGPISNKKYYEDFIAKELDADQIIYVGHLEHRNLNALIGSCGVTLFLSTWEEPYGLAIAESLACGTPVVAWDKGASPELLTEACGVLVPENDFEKLKDAVIKAFDLDRRECRKRAERFCSIETMVNSYEKLYEQLVEANSEKMIAVL